MANNLSRERQDKVAAFFIAWCEAHKRAGYLDDAVVQVSPWGSTSAAQTDAPAGPEQGGNGGEIIPEGTLAWASILVRPFNLDQGLVLTPSKSTEGNAYLDVELTILEGPHAGRKVCDTIDVEGGGKTDGMAKVRRILEVGREIGTFSSSNPQYRLGKPGDQGDIVLMELNELRCAVKIGIDAGQKDSAGNKMYPDKNRVRAYLSPNPASGTPEAFTSYQGFKKLLNDRSGSSGGVTSELTPPAGPVTLRLDDAAGIAQAYLAAISGHEGDDVLAGAAVGVLGQDGAIETMAVTFDDHKEVASSQHIGWSEVEGRYCVSALDESDEGGSNWGRIEPEKQDAERLAVWGSRTKLIKMAGGHAAEFNVGGEGGNVRHHVCRWGIVDRAIRGGDETERALQEIGLTALGGIRLGHILSVKDRGTHGATMDSALLQRVAAKWKMCGGNFDLIAKMPGVIAENQSVSFVAPRWIPRGELVVVAGDAGVGKSTLFHDLALIVGTKPEERDADRLWLDVPVADIAHGTVIFLSGEDGASILLARRDALGGDDSVDIIEIPLNGDVDATASLDSLRSVPNVTLLVVDPARSFIKGNEDDSANVDEALSTLVRFGAEKGCAVVMLHHLRKNARPATPHDAVEGLRGSGAFKARARVVIGMVRRSDVISLGVTKSALPPQFPMQTETRKFRRQGNGIPRLVAQDPTAVAVVASLPQTGDADHEVARVVEAIAGAHRRGDRVTNTGRQGIFERRLPELSGMSRVSVRAAAKRAAVSGAITVTAGGYLVPAGAFDISVATIATGYLVNAATEVRDGRN